MIFITREITQTNTQITVPLKSDISHNFLSFVHFNFVRIEIQEIHTAAVESVSIPLAALEFKRLAVVKHPVKLVSPFIIADIQNTHKLWEAATNFSEFFDVLSARQVD